MQSLKDIIPNTLRLQSDAVLQAVVNSTLPAKHRELAQLELESRAGYRPEVKAEVKKGLRAYTWNELNEAKAELSKNCPNSVALSLVREEIYWRSIADNQNNAA